MGIEILDHIILSRAGYYSFKENDPRCLHPDIEELEYR